MTIAQKIPRFQKYGSRMRFCKSGEYCRWQDVEAFINKLNADNVSHDRQIIIQNITPNRVGQVFHIKIPDLVMQKHYPDWKYLYPELKEEYLDKFVKEIAAALDAKEQPKHIISFFEAQPYVAGGGVEIVRAEG